MVRTTVYLDEQDKLAIKRRSRMKGISEAEVIRQALHKDLYPARKTLPSFVGLGESDPEMAKLDKKTMRKLWGEHLERKKGNLGNS